MVGREDDPAADDAAGIMRADAASGGWMAAATAREPAASNGDGANADIEVARDRPTQVLALANLVDCVAVAKMINAPGAHKLVEVQETIDHDILESIFFASMQSAQALSDFEPEDSANALKCLVSSLEPLLVPAAAPLLGASACVLEP